MKQHAHLRERVGATATVGATAVTFSSNATNQTFCTGESIDFEVTFPLAADVTNYRYGELEF